MTGATLPPEIEPTALSWHTGQPVYERSGEAGPHHFNEAERARHGYVHSSCLAERFAGVGAGGHFVVADTSFGNGLNFLTTWQAWEKSNTNPHACLHFISVEPHPLTRDNLTSVLLLYPELAPFAEELIACYPPLVHGTHRLVLGRGRVRLTLYFGDFLHALRNLEFSADAWFISSFPAARHCETQDQQVVSAVTHHSFPGTTVVTPGTSDSPYQGPASPTAYPTAHHSKAQQSVAIIGAGIAGATLAANLAQRGFRVTLIDKAEQAATQASGNSQGALYVKLGVEYNDQTQLALSSLLFSQRFYGQFKDRGWHPTGLIQLAYNETEADRQNRFLKKNHYPLEILRSITASQATELSGLPVPHGGLWFPGSGWLQPAKLCRQLADLPDIDRQFGFDVTRIERKAQCWQLTSQKGEALTFDKVVLCAGADTPELIPIKSQFRMKRIRGQVTEIAASHLNAPSLVLCGPGYVNPAHQNKSLVGATFDLHDSSATLSDSSDQENLKMLSGLLPAALKHPIGEAIDGAVSGRVAFRCTTHDYQPIAGSMKTRDGEQLEGLYLMTGLGSKGLTYTPLLAEYLGDVLSDQPLCLPRNLIRRIETQRSHRPQVTQM